MIQKKNEEGLDEKIKTNMKEENKQPILGEGEQCEEEENQEGEEVDMEPVKLYKGR